jgi:hypothetical protein
LVPPAVGTIDRSLIVPSANDPGFVQFAGARIDPRIIAAPRVQGLPIQTAGWMRGR